MLYNIWLRMKKIKFEHIRITIYIISLILTLLVFLGKINITCYYKENFGILCPACGLTRATANILKLRFREAYELNAFYTCVLIPFVSLLVINDIYIIFKRYITGAEDVSLVEIMLGEKKFEQY